MCWAAASAAATASRRSSRRPTRIAAAVLQNPIGLWENRDTWDAAVKGYSETVRGRDPSISEATIQSFGHNMFGPPTSSSP